MVVVEAGDRVVGMRRFVRSPILYAKLSGGDGDLNRWSMTRSHCNLSAEAIVRRKRKTSIEPRLMNSPTTDAAVHALLRSDPSQIAQRVVEVIR